MVIPEPDEELDVDKIREIARLKKKNKKSDSSCDATNGSHDIADEFENEEEEDKKVVESKIENKFQENIFFSNKVKEMKSIMGGFDPEQKAKKDKMRALTIMGGTITEEFKMRTERATKKINEADDFLKKGENIKALKCAIEVIFRQGHTNLHEKFIENVKADLIDSKYKQCIDLKIKLLLMTADIHMLIGNYAESSRVASDVN